MGHNIEAFSLGFICGVCTFILVGIVYLDHEWRRDRKLRREQKHNGQ